MLLLIATAILVGAICGLIIYARWHYGVFERAGIPTAKPAFILGSDPDLHNVVAHEKDFERFQKFGPIWGAYEGRRPMLFIADAEIARHVLIKEFEIFRDRRIQNFGHELFNEMLDILPYGKWKPLRAAFTPAFTTGKIRLMSTKIEQAVVDCVAHIHKEVGPASEKLFDVKKVFVALTTDVLARCIFGMHLNDVNDPENAFVKATADLVGDAEDPPASLSWFLSFPIVPVGMPIFPTTSLEFFGSVLRNVLKTRREEKVVQNDMVDALNELIAKIPTPEFKSKNITETTILCQAVLFLFAGFETTATTLSMLCYYLALNPEKQRKLIAELDEFVEKNGEKKLTHDNLTELPYMNACINEALRLNPPMIRSERVCEKDWKHAESGLVIKKGWVVMVASYALHRNEKYWSEPEKFIPERFLPENKEKFNPYAFNAFGQGPRNCIGMRFAKEELVYSLALVLKDFAIEPTSETKLKFKPGRLFLTQYEPIIVKFVRRNK